VGNTKKIIDGAISLVLYGILLLLVLFVPIISTIALFFLPLPFIYYTAKYKWKYGLFLFLVGIFFTGVIGGVTLLPISIIFTLTGVALGWQYSEGKGRLSAYMAATTTFLLTLVAIFVLYLTVAEINFIQEFKNSVNEYTNLMIENLGMLDADTEDMLRNQVQMIMNSFLVLLPSLFVIVSAIAVLIVQLIALPILKRMGAKVPEGKPFRELSLPKGFVWLYLAIILISFIPMNSGSFLFTAFSNIYNVFQILFVIQGISFIFYFSHKKGIHKSIPIVILALGLFLPGLYMIVQILGVIDVGFDLRKRVKNKHM